ncbi:MAG TPA: hypothetical protein VFN91_15670 [Myxococcaceae bacterium]|nr:hypothetical protein [Myxococcaceae bacterium]
MRVPLVVSLVPLALALACSDEGPLQTSGAKLTISPTGLSVETGADPVSLQAVPQNGDLTGNVTWDLLDGAGAGTLGSSTGTNITFTPADLGSDGGVARVKAVATVGGTSQSATAAIQVVASTHGRLVLDMTPPDNGAGWVDVTNLGSGTNITFTSAVPQKLRSPIIDAGTYQVTADAGIFLPGSVVDATWDGTVSFDGGTPARSISVPVLPNRETTAVVRFDLRAFLGRIWIPYGGAIRGYSETELVVRDSLAGFSTSGAVAIAFDADGNLWATFPDAVRMFTPDALTAASPVAAKTVTLAGATGIAIRGTTVAVASCSGNAVSTFTRTDASPSPTAFIPSVTCPWGISYDGGNTGKLWVASKSGANGNKVYRYPATGGNTSETSFAVTDAYGVAVDTSGNVWASSCSGNFVQQLTPSVGSQITLPEFICPGGLAFDKGGKLWVISTGDASNPGNLTAVNVAPPGPPSSVPQLSQLTQVTFGGIAFDPAAAGLPTHQ